MGNQLKKNLACLLLLTTLLFEINLFSCASQSSSTHLQEPYSVETLLHILRQVYGPPPAFSLIHRQFEYDFNGDKIPETVILFFDHEELWANPQVKLPDLRTGLVCYGFAVFTRIEEKFWPVFYQFEEYRMKLRLDQIDGLPHLQLVRDLNHDGWQTIWGWSHHPGHEEDDPPQWKTCSREWDRKAGSWSNRWHNRNFIFVNIGK